ncbi:hypothetical protein [Butyrivibrio sp.]|uniref:hypothetical protein n=1 Tax=Butyrivibrio sp. TaxID=28121 RepID=UPI0025C55881|nr:hypothetical protein [Butyrivibrio sp.]MBE5837782.1 hypothetical protein [Butyrivibrio sp.]
MRVKLSLMLSLVAICISGCGNATPEDGTEKRVEEQIETVEEAAGAVSTEAEVEEQTLPPITKYTVSFTDAANEAIVVNDGEQIVIPDYEGIKLVEDMNLSDITLDEEGYYCLDGERVCPEERAVVDEEGKNIILKNLSIPYELIYMVNSEDDTVYPVRVITKEEPTNSGICLVFEYDDKEDGTRIYGYKGITDMFNRDIAQAEIYKGVFQGWSEEQDSENAEYKEGDSITVSNNLALLPIFSTDGIELSDTTEGTEFEGINEISEGIQKVVATTKWGNIGVNDKGRVITDSATSTVNQETGVVSEVQKASISSQASSAGSDTIQQSGGSGAYYEKNIPVKIINGHQEFLRYEYVSQAEIDAVNAGYGTNPYAGAAAWGVPFVEVTAEDEERSRQEWEALGRPEFHAE